MKIIQPVSQTVAFTGVTNLYHLFYIYNIREVLVDKQCKVYVDDVFTRISQIQVDFNITEPIEPDYLSKKMIKKYGAKEYLQSTSLKAKYDLLVVHRENFHSFIPFMHRAVYIFVHESKNDDLIYTPYTKVNDCFEGILYLNDFHSMIFPSVRLDVFQQTYVRDKPYRFLKKMEWFMTELMKPAQKLTEKGKKKKGKYGTIVEIGSCRTPMKHNLDELNPACCNDSHSTFFWCRTPCTVYTVDVNPMCETVLDTAFSEKRLVINGKLNIEIMDGLKFLKDYDSKENGKIEFLFLDAWDVIPGHDYAEKHLEAYQLAKEHMSEKAAFISIDDTDIANGGKGKLLFTELLDDGWIMLYKGRHTTFYRGPLEKLFIKRHDEIV